MSDIAVAKVSRHGGMTIPSELRERLDLKAGGCVSIHPVGRGFLVAKAGPAGEVDRGAAFEAAVAPLWQAHAERGITEDEQLDALIEEAQEHAYKERYGDSIAPSLL